MRRIILIIFLFFTFLHSNNFDVEVDKNLETKLKPNIFDDDMDFTKLSTNGYISIFSKSLNKEFKLRIINSLVVKGIIPLVKDWELKNNNLKFSNIPDDISLIGYGSYMGEKKKKKEAQKDYVCSNGKLDVNNIRTKTHFKPDWNLDYFCSYNYLSHTTTLRGKFFSTLRK